MHFSSTRAAKFLCALLLVSATATADNFRIAAASSLQFALRDILKAYSQSTGNSAPQVVYGSSGNLFRQIMQGAPYDLFLSADETLVSRLYEAGMAVDSGSVFGSGRVVLFANNSSTIELDNAGAGIQKALASDTVFKFALANPRHAPYGRAGKQALESLDLWQALEPHIVIGEKVSQTAKYVTTGAASIGIISLTLARAPEIEKHGTYAVLPASTHKPLNQRLVLVNGYHDDASLLVEFISSPKAKLILQRYGLQ